MLNINQLPGQDEEMFFIPLFLFQRWFYELTSADLKRFDASLIEYLKVGKLISTGRITRVNDKTVFKFLKICENDLKEREILKI